MTQWSSPPVRDFRYLLRWSLFKFHRAFSQNRLLQTDKKSEWGSRTFSSFRSSRGCLAEYFAWIFAVDLEFSFPELRFRMTWPCWQSRSWNVIKCKTAGKSPHYRAQKAEVIWRTDNRVSPTVVEQHGTTLPREWKSIPYTVGILARYCLSQTQVGTRGKAWHPSPTSMRGLWQP